MSAIDRIGRACSSRETLQTTYDLARLAIEHEIPGDFVECGVAYGAQCAAMALAIMHGLVCHWHPLFGTVRRVHLFDSFEGVPAPTVHDVEWIREGHPVGTSACSLEQVKVNMAEWGIDPELLVYHPGLFTETMKQPYCGSIAILRLDGDLYESTKACIEKLFPLVSPGGWIICDDWDLSGARKAVTEFMEQRGGAYGPVYWRKQP